jgi:sterol desaturase/sphingolipid hydroxylase (fatty acid hydroxylase superfamily)
MVQLLFMGFCFLIGYLAWWTFEYSLHRWGGHGRGHPKAFYNEHQAHHRIKDYFSPAWLKVCTIMGLASVFVVGAAVMNGVPVLWMLAGFLSAYGIYECTHYRNHMVAPRTAAALRRRKLHFVHHFEDAHRNFSFSQPLIDRLLGTALELDQVKVPRAMAMGWLLGEDGEIKSEYRNHFKLTPTPSKTGQNLKPPGVPATNHQNVGLHLI